MAQAPGDLLGGPAGTQTALDLPAQSGIAHQLASTGRARITTALRQ